MGLNRRQNGKKKGKSTMIGYFQETAINIGYSCKLLTEEMKEVFVIEGTNEYEVEVQLKDIKRRIGRSKPKVLICLWRNQKF